MEARPGSRLERFKVWWRAPATVRDRILGAIVGVFGGFWLGVLSYFALGSLSQPVTFVALVAVTRAVGVVFPKVVIVVLFPFSIFGGNA